MSKVNDVLLKYGKLTPEQHAVLEAKETAKEKARADIKGKGDKLTKAQILALAETLAE